MGLSIMRGEAGVHLGSRRRGVDKILYRAAGNHLKLAGSLVGERGKNCTRTTKKQLGRGPHQARRRGGREIKKKISLFQPKLVSRLKKKPPSIEEKRKRSWAS